MNWLHFTAGVGIGMAVMFCLLIVALGLIKRSIPKEQREANERTFALLTEANAHRRRIASQLTRISDKLIYERGRK